jgi:hypothetical protein
MFCSKTNKKGNMSAAEKTYKVRFHRKAKRRKRKKKKGAKTLLKFDQPITQLFLFLFGMYRS